MLRKIKRIARPYAGAVAILCVLTVLSGLLQVSIAFCMREVVDAALTAPEKLVMDGALLVGNLLLMVLIQSITSWISGTASDRCIANMRRQILRSLAYSEDESRRDYHSGSLLSRAMEDVRTLCDGVIHALPGLVGQLTRLIASFTAVLLLYPSIATYVALAAVAAVAVAAVLRPLLKKHHKRVRTVDERMIACMQEDLRNLDLVKSFQAEEQMLSRFGQKVDDSLQAKRDRRVLSVGISTMISGLSNLTTAVMLLWGAAQVADRAMTYGSLTAMLQLLSLLRSPVLGISGLWSRFAAVEVAAERLEEMLFVPDVQPHAVSAQINAVVFDRVTFTYPGEDVPVLENFSVRFSLDGWICLTGVSGRGKSTMFKLMLGLYQPQKGCVYLESPEGNIPCGPETRGYFGYVPQDYPMFSGTVMENLLLVSPEADEVQCKKALEAACAEFVMTMPEGLHALLREGGDGLSKGQLQRVAAARAVLMDRQILLLDECASALDAGTERTMLRNLRALNSKAILVTHRPEALEGLEGVQFANMEQTYVPNL